MDTIEHKRLEEARERNIPWKKWGPYLSERQWGTVREDYSKDGNAWDYFSHDHARSRAYHWGEDGIAGISDEKQRLCFAIALWNEKDPILKERLFGLTNSEGNHGEDVKEYYFYLDNTPTHSYMKYLYKYPQKAYPYSDLAETNKKRSRAELEYELIDTGAFDDDRYFDVFVEYAKASPEDILIEISVFNRGPDAASVHVLPTLWFRNTWKWWKNNPKPQLKELAGGKEMSIVGASHETLGGRFLYCEGRPPLLFTENETNNERIFGIPNETPYVKDGINNYLVQGSKNVINPAKTGTKTAPHYQLKIDGGSKAAIRLRLSDSPPDESTALFSPNFERILAERRREADEFYKIVIHPSIGQDAAAVMRQALAGMLWSKQYYIFDADLWLKEHEAHPFFPQSRPSRNKEWFHMVNDHIISMPDKWEYPWYAAWDLAFHAVVFSAIDRDFAKEQLRLMLQETYQHPSGQVPAYEWNFSDVNPPVHAWATIFIHRSEQNATGGTDVDFLRQSFRKLLLNFTWWVNRKDRFGKNVFEGGFLGLDNIGVFDRSSALPRGGYLEQADGTAWMSLFCQNMLELSLELTAFDQTYEDLVLKFAEHFLWIAAAMNRIGHDGLWDEEDGFYYDLLRFPDGTSTRLKVRSLVGLLPICATTVIEPWQRGLVPRVTGLLRDRLEKMPELLKSIHQTGKSHLGYNERGIIALVNQERLRRILTRMLDENEFLGDHGIRAISKYHLEHPYIFKLKDEEYRVSYQPAESDSGLFGGNSNWRGPIWMPMNVIILRGLLQYYLYYGGSFKIECPTGSGKLMDLFEVSQEIARRLTTIFLRDGQGKRPVYGGTEKFQTDPFWRDHILFYEYFNGDNGAGLGASHQTGWTGLVAVLIQLYAMLDPKEYLEKGVGGIFKNPRTMF